MPQVVQAAEGATVPHHVATHDAGAGAPRIVTQRSILVLGDSLSAGYGLPENSDWVDLLRKRLLSSRIDYSVANGSVSGDTTSGGLARLPALLARDHPSIVIVELGGNDALRGIDLTLTTTNLHAIIETSLAARARVVLVGMQIPPNYGPDYTKAFQDMYQRLAQQYKLAFVPFLLEGIADQPQSFQADQIHPTAAAQPRLLDNVWSHLSPLLR
ncbi:MAG: arylesterase [Janthinobacterium lividum]